MSKDGQLHQKGRGPNEHHNLTSKDNHVVDSTCSVNLNNRMRISNLVDGHIPSLDHYRHPESNIRTNIDSADDSKGDNDEKIGEEDLKEVKEFKVYTRQKYPYSPSASSAQSSVDCVVETDHEGEIPLRSICCAPNKESRFGSKSPSKPPHCPTKSSSNSTLKSNSTSTSSLFSNSQLPLNRLVNMGARHLEYPDDPSPNRVNSQKQSMDSLPQRRSAERISSLFTNEPVYYRSDPEGNQLSSDPNIAGPSTYHHPLAPSYLPRPPFPPQHPSQRTRYSPGPSSYQHSPTSNFHTNDKPQPDSKRRRGRLATACTACNRRKQKCNGDTPCVSCAKRRERCIYPTENNTSYNADAERARQTAMSSSFNSHSPTHTPNKKARMSRGGSVAELRDDMMNTPVDRREGSRHLNRELKETHGRSEFTSGRRRDNEYSGIHHHAITPLTTPGSNQSSRISLPLTPHPTSSERSNQMISRFDFSNSQLNPEPSLSRFWKSRSDLRGSSLSSTDPAFAKVVKESSNGNGSAGASGSGSGRGSNDKDDINSLSESDKLMEENEAHGVGSLRTHTGPWDGGRGEKTFFGTSHFGPQLAAKVIRSMPTVPLSDVRHAPYRGTSRLDTVKPYTLESQTRDLVSYLPAREECDRYVRRFLERYNSHNDILYQPDFMISYHLFWNEYNIKQSLEIDLRYLSLLLIVLALGVLLDHDPSEKLQRQDQITRLNLTENQNIVIGDMIEQLENQTMSLKDREEKSSKWSWASKRALMESSGFFGESMDTVRAGLLIALYLNVCRRVPEAWSAIGTAIRAAQAQGLHVDGSSWKGMTTKEAELRRRLWAQLYAVDRSISLFLGRPVCIQDGEFTTLEPANMHDEELETSSSIFPRGLNIPTKTTFLILHYRLSKIIGKVQSKCFNLTPRNYNDIIECEELFSNFKKELPTHFKLDREGTNFDLDFKKEYSWLKIQRQTLNSKFHLARISLHRPYLLRSLSINSERGKGKKKDSNDPYIKSRDALLYSAMADLQLRFLFNELDPLDRFKWMTVASGFNSATILGILCHLGYKDARFPRGSLRLVLQDYISLEEKTIRRDEALETELMVLKMMEAKALAREEIDMRGGRNTPGSALSFSTSSNNILDTSTSIEQRLNTQIHQSNYIPPSLTSSQTQNRNDSPSITNTSKSPLSILPNSASIISETATGYFPPSQVVRDIPITDPREEPQSKTINTQYENTAAVPPPSAHSTSAPSISTTFNYSNYTTNNNQTQNSNQWYLPSDWDPTSSGLPDSSDPSAWQALLGMDWMNNLDLDMGLNSATSGGGGGGGGAGEGENEGEGEGVINLNAE